MGNRRKGIKEGKKMKREKMDEEKGKRGEKRIKNVRRGEGGK